MADEPLNPGEEDREYDPSIEPKSSRAWLAIIADAEKAFKAYQDKADGIDKLYADLERLSTDARDRQFQLFWANVQVLGPSIYARTPVPVVVPKFKDRRPLYTASSEMLERCTVVTFDLTDINSVMLLLRDDLTVTGRGSAWVRYETKGESETESERVVVEHVDRKDFLHEPARKWAEVGWVARAAYMSRKDMRKRFSEHSGDAYNHCSYAIQKEDRDNGAADNRSKAKVWEIWSKDENRVVWVSEGCDKLLDEGAPHLSLEGFFPCPKPAYATTQRRSLIPIPDVVFYKDQLEEINQLTGRIHALAEAVRVRGFYPAGASDLGDAIEAAIKSTDDRQVLIPISNWAAFGGNGGDPIVWLPIEVIAATIQALVELRRQVIDDVYQIMGLSDIMRGSTEKEETLGAQELKAQFGSVRIRDKQTELIRIARDIVRIGAEIMAENFAPKTLLEMSQMEIPTDAQQKAQVDAIVAQYKGMVKQAMADPEIMKQAQANPQMAQQVMQHAQQQAQGEIEKITKQPTVEQIIGFLRDNKTRPFVLDIETDSTIAPDEQAEKQSRTEFVTALGGLLQQFGPVVAQVPQAAPLMGEVLKFALAPFRAGREMEGKIDEAVEQLGAMAGQQRPDPEAEKMKAEMAMKQQEMQAKAKIEQEKIAADRETNQIEAASKREENDAKMRQIEAEMIRDEKKGQLEIQKMQMDIMAKREELQIKRETMQIDVQARQQQAAIQTRSAEQQAEIKSQQAEQQARHSEMEFQQKSALTDQQAAAKAQQGAM